MANCRSLKYALQLPIPTTQGSESIFLEFPQLQHLELRDLPNLVGFYSTRISGSQVPSTIPLFNQKVALPRLELLRLISMDNIRTIWHSQHPIGSCCNMKKLKLLRCENLETVFPSNFSKGLQGPEIVKIKKCPSLKEIFEIKSSTVVPTWKESPLHSQRNEDPREYIAFQNLNSMSVKKCPSLKHIFPASVIKGLKLLEALKIINCGVEEIVATEGGFQATPIFLFPKLIYLVLSKLFQLKRFYLGMYTLGFPLLKNLVLFRCENVELVFQEKGLQADDDKQPLFMVDKNTFPNMEKLTLLSLKEAVEIWRGQFSMGSFDKLRNLVIWACPSISFVIPSRMLQVLYNLQRLELNSCKLVEKVIQVEGVVEGDETVLLPHLTIIHLEALPMLTHLSRFGLGPILRNLYELQVSGCENLINIVSSSSMAKRLAQLKKLSITNCSMVKEIVGDDDVASEEEALVDDDICLAFPSLEEMKVKKLPRLTHLYKQIHGVGQNLQKLRILKVDGCGNLEIVLTLSMTKTLVQLEELTVSDCDKVKEIIVGNIEGGDDQSTDDDPEIIFTKLRILHLHRLPNLTSFCSARCSLRFPCLTQMSMMECPEMECFCIGDSTTPRLQGVEGVEGTPLCWEKDLNATIHKMFTETNSEKAPHVLNTQHSKEEDLEEWDSEELNLEGEDPKKEFSVEEDADEGNSEELHIQS